MYEPAPSEKELAAFGMTLDDVATDQVEVWPEFEQAFDLFASMGTQWRVGMSGATGLDYNVLYRKMDRMGLTPDEYDEIERDVQIMENAALECMHQKT